EVRNRPSTIDGVLEFLRSHQPPALIATGAKDPLFPEANMRHYLDDLPDAEFHALDTGHFALEDKGDEIAALMRDFLERVLATERGKTVKAIEARNDGAGTEERALRTHAPGEQP